MANRGRVPLKQTVNAGAVTSRFYASASPRALSADAVALATPAERQEPRKRAVKNARPEGEAQDAVIDWLLANPRVHGLKRLNKGVAVEGSRRIAYSHVYGKHEGEYMTALDLEFWYSRFAHSTWPVEIEMKAPGFTKPNLNDRTQRMQWARIQYVRAHGGIAGFCTSVDEVRQLLESAC